MIELIGPLIALGIFLIFLSPTIYRIYKRSICEHEFRYSGKYLSGISLLMNWRFICPKCDCRKSHHLGMFPTKESYDHYKELMGANFERNWCYIISDNLSKTVMDCPGLREKTTVRG